MNAELDSTQYSSRQADLRHELKRLDPALETIFLGALHALADSGNPDQIAHASHGFREMIGRLPRVLDVPMSEAKESLGSKAQELRSVVAVARASPCFRGGNWEGNIDAKLRGALKRVDAFCVWLEEHRPRRKEAFLRAIRTLDVSATQAPHGLQIAVAAEWQDLNQFFTNVSHHGASPTMEEFSQRVGELEQFLLDRFQPRTFEDQEAIDRILERGRERGDS